MRYIKAWDEHDEWVVARDAAAEDHRKGLVDGTTEGDFVSMGYTKMD